MTFVIGFGLVNKVVYIVVPTLAKTNLTIFARVPPVYIYIYTTSLNKLNHCSKIVQVGVGLGRG